MYQVYADGQILWSSDMSTEETAIADPRLSLEVNTAGTFEFTIHPTHYLYDSLFKMKTIIQVLWDDTEIFYGRVLDTERSMYLEKNVTCEGALAFLNDSVQQPLDPKTKYSVTQVMQMLIEAHNNQTEAEKHFTLGTVTLGGSETYNFDRQTFEDSRSALEDLLELFDGYVRIRHEDGTMYLDLLDDYDRTVNQNIEFGVNLADLTVNDQADDLFTALYPLGAKNVTVASVNDGNPIIEDEDLVAIYGKIVRAQTFDGVSDPAVLLQNGREYLQTYGVQIPMEYDIKAIDLHFFDYEKDLLLPGFTVPILSAPHDIDEDSLICIRCELELQNPENNSYTIGIPDPFNGGGSGGMSYGNTSLTNTVNRTTKRMTNDENKLSLTYDEIDIKAAQLTADVENIKVRTSSLEITTSDLSGRTSGLETTVTIEQGKIETLVSTSQNHETRITQNTNAIALKANASDVSAQFTVQANQISSLVTSTNNMQTQITQNKNDITLRATKTEVSTEVDKLEAKIQVNADAITLKASQTDVNSKTANLQSQITVANNQIELKASKTDVNSQVANLEAAIQVNADAITTKVSAGEIASSINQTAQEVKIAARKIDLSGYVTASELNAVSASINNLTSGSTTATHLRTSAFTVTASSFSLGGSTYTSATRNYVSSLTTKTVSIQDSVTGQVTTFKAVDSFTTSGATFLVRLNT